MNSNDVADLLCQALRDVIQELRDIEDLLPSEEAERVHLLAYQLEDVLEVAQNALEED